MSPTLMRSSEPRGQTACSSDDRATIAALRAGDEAAFRSLVALYHTALVFAAKSYVRSWEVAEEAAQDAWLGLLKGLDRFEGRSSLKVWLFRILANRAKSIGMREQRSIAFSRVPAPDADGTTAGSRFLDYEPAKPLRSGQYASIQHCSEQVPEEYAAARETRELIARAIGALPPKYRCVLLLRVVDGLTATEVCTRLSITELHQRVLLHRARARLWACLQQPARAEPSATLPRAEPKPAA